MESVPPLRAPCARTLDVPVVGVAGPVRAGAAGTVVGSDEGDHPLAKATARGVTRRGPSVADGTFRGIASAAAGAVL